MTPHSWGIVVVPSDCCRQINDKPGQEEVELVRKFGDETIRVIFSISDFNTLSDENAAAPEDLGEDEFDANDSSRPDGQANAKESDGKKPSAADDVYESGYDEEASFPARVNVIIEKVLLPNRFLMSNGADASSCSPAKALSRLSPLPRTE